MSLTPAIERAHAAAQAQKQQLYRDPTTGNWVMTAGYLAERGYCCGNGCRHCPYSAEEQRRAGRPGS